MSDVIVREKADYHTRTTEQMEQHLLVPPWSLRQKIALSCRILAAEGHESALAGQITARGDRPKTYWMLSFGLGFAARPPRPVRASQPLTHSGRFCLHTALPWNVFCRDCIVWGSKFGGTSMEKIMLLCLIIGVIGVLAELWPVLPPLK